MRGTRSETRRGFGVVFAPGAPQPAGSPPGSRGTAADHVERTPDSCHPVGPAGPQGSDTAFRQRRSAVMATENSGAAAFVGGLAARSQGPQPGRGVIAIGGREAG